MHPGSNRASRTPRFLGALAALAVGGLIVGTLASIAPTRAEAQSSTVTVLGIRSLEGDDEFARNLTGAIRHSASQVEGWVVSDREVTLAQMALVHGCDEVTQACMAEIANSLEAQRVIYGEVRRTNATDDYDFSLNLHVFSAQAGEIEQSLAETLPGERTDIDDVREAVHRFVASLSGAPRVGRLLVSVNVPGAEVFIDDTSVGVADNQGRLTVEDVEAGTRHVHVVAEGHNNFRSTVSVEPYGESSFEAELQLGGGGGGVPLELVAGVGLLVVTAASVGLWIWSMVEVDTINTGMNDLTHFRDDRNDEDVYFTARDEDVCVEHGGFGDESPVLDTGVLCERAVTFEVLQFVFLGLAAVSAGVGTYLLITNLGDEGDPESATLQLTPSFNQYGGSVGLSGRF